MAVGAEMAYEVCVAVACVTITGALAFAVWEWMELR